MIDLSKIKPLNGTVIVEKVVEEIKEKKSQEEGPKILLPKDADLDEPENLEEYGLYRVVSIVDGFSRSNKVLIQHRLVQEANIQGHTIYFVNKKQILMEIDNG